MGLGRDACCPYADAVPAAPDGPTTSGPMPATQATSVVLRASVILTAAAGLLATVAAGALRGGNAALGAALGAIIALTFFAVGQYAIGRLLSGNPQFALSGALLVYLTQVLVLFGLIVALRGATWLDPKSFAATIVLCTLVWIGAQLWASQRIKVLYVEPRPEPEEER